MDANTNNYGLSGREFQIMELVSIGKYNKEIAAELNIKPDTIAKHLNHIFEKMGVQNRTEATVKFFKLGGMLILPNEN
jgi:two-component system, NarL family, nitrate/nitrite response regulator NarL